MYDHDPFTTANMKLAVTVCCQAIPPRGNGKGGPDDAVRQGQAANDRKSCTNRTVKHAEMSLPEVVRVSTELREYIHITLTAMMSAKGEERLRYRKAALSK